MMNIFFKYFKLQSVITKCHTIKMKKIKKKEIETTLIDSFIYLSKNNNYSEKGWQKLEYF